MTRPFHGVCDKCGSKTNLQTVQRSPGDWTTFYTCPNCDTGPKAFAEGCLAQLILVAMIGIGMSLLRLLVEPEGELGLIKVLLGLIGLVIVGLIIKAIW